MDRPILFSGPMVRALLDGRKTQTRRVLSNSRYTSIFNGEWADSYVMDPGNQSWRDQEVRYAAGDRLWVREAWRADDYAPDETIYRADAPADVLAETKGVIRWKPGIHMHRKRSRLTLPVTEVRVQRLQEISEADAKAEGMSPLPSGRYFCGHDDDGEITCKSPVTAFGWLWNSINGERPGCHWQDNPWIVAVTFTVERRNIDEAD